jgi:citrate/tricarballylate utilization protein
VPHSDPLREGRRILTICNACRYCEGYCAVFPAMERRFEFGVGDLDYLANLCHNCAECYYACQYAPPHEFAVNVPKVLAEIRLDSYRRHARPRIAAGVFATSGGYAAAVLLVAFVAGLMLAAIGQRGSFYEVISHRAMVGIFGGVAVLIVAAMRAGLAAFWRETGARGTQTRMSVPLSILTLENLSSGGAGCTYPDARHSNARRWFHHCTFYGFALCFASTSVAAWYHYVLGLRAPYPYLSLPVVLGTLGGMGLLIGPAGLYWLKRHRDPAIGDAAQDGMDRTLVVLLFATSLTGLALEGLRETAAMGVLLVVHLASVLALFATMPFGKFVHGIYRAAALVRYAAERPHSNT